MRLWFGGCPRAGDLEALAVSSRASPRVARHVADCATCSRIVEELRRDAALLAQLRAAAGARDDHLRAHVLDICREVASEIRRVPPA